MRNARSRCTPTAGRFDGLIALLALAGCQEDEITHAIVPRYSEPEKTRLLAVIYPHGEQTWFFKLTGPESAVKDAEESFNDFMHSVKFTNKVDRPVSWTTPEGWKQEDGPEPLYATLHLGAAEKPLKLTVATLPRKPDNEILDNVNRWRRQLGLGPVTETGLSAVVKNLEMNKDPITLVDMSGPGAAAAGKPAAKGSAWTYKKPDGWVETPHPEAGPLPREAIFQTDDGAQTAEVTVTALGGAAGGLDQNVSRWCNQIGAAPPTAKELDQFPKITVGGRESTYLDLAGAKARIVGAIVAHGDKTWFFKMTGPTAVVEKQKSKFEEFLKSVKFDAAGGDQ